MRIAIAAATCAVLSLLIVAQTSAKTKSHRSDPNGAVVFAQNCVSCHAAGANSVNRRRPLAGSPKLANLPMFKSYLENPVGHMPFYKHVVSDQKALRALYEYCKTLKPSKGA